MVKLQSIKRANGSVVNSVNLPLELINQLNWIKGDDLKIELGYDSLDRKFLRITKVGEPSDG